MRTTSHASAREAYNAGDPNFSTFALLSQRLRKTISVGSRLWALHEYFLGSFGL
jgi:hypothetical protein